ncbi:metal ABC transporter permease [Edwardsiella anguillarum]|nr:metal ABC transporter permease [Edwardsiella anguillarum]
MLTTALTIGLAMKFVGALIITSLLIIPAATARRFARTPEQMAAGAVLAGLLAISGGLAFSAWYDTRRGRRWCCAQPCCLSSAWPSPERLNLSTAQKSRYSRRGNGIFIAELTPRDRCRSAGRHGRSRCARAGCAV